MYSTYETPVMGEVECEARPSGPQEGRHPRRRAEPHRPGHRVRLLLLPRLLRAVGCRLRDDHGQLQPETVSTDYDTSDRLYFEPLTFEHVMEILRVEQDNGHASRRDRAVRRADAPEDRGALEAAGIPILGTSPDAIDLAEDRERFQALVREAGPETAVNGIASSDDAAARRAEAIGFPAGDPAVLRARRPRYGDRARHRSSRTLHPRGRRRFRHSPVLLDSYLSGATEVDVDALCDGTRRCTSPASCSTSRRPACTPATAPARCRPTRSRPRSSTSSIRRRRRSPSLGVVGADERPVRGEGRRARTRSTSSR